MSEVKHLWKVILTPSTTPGLLTVAKGNLTLRIGNSAISPTPYPVAFESIVNALLYLSQIQPNLTWDEFRQNVRPLLTVICPHMDTTAAVLHPICAQCPHCQKLTTSTIMTGPQEPAYPYIICPNCGQRFSVEPQASKQNPDPGKGGTS